MATVYSEIETVVAQQVIQSLQDRINLYLGTSTTKGEVRTRDIGLYEKKTFKTLLEYYAEKVIYEKDQWFSAFGRRHFSEVEVNNIRAQVYVNVTGWVRDWEEYHKAYPEVRVSDIRGKRSKIIHYSLMLKAGWKNIKNIVREEASKLRTIYKKYVIYSFTTSTERLEIEERYPDKQFIDVTEFRRKLRENALARIGSDYNVQEDIFDDFVTWTSDILEEESSESIRWEGYAEDQKDSVKQHHQSFIDYMTLQVFGDRGYLFGLNRENINTAISVGNVPSMSDFQDFMLARAESEAHKGEFSKEGTRRHEYGPDDVTLVKKLNQRFVNEVAVPRYEGSLIDNDIIDNEDKITGTAFGYRIPNSDILKKIEERISDATQAAWESMGEAAEPEDVVKFINDAGKEIAKENGVDDSFAEPYSDAGYNKYKKNYDTYRLKNSPKSTAEDPGDTYKTKDGRNYVRWKKDKIPYVDWKKYKTPGYSYKERTYNWERYHGSGNVASEFVPTYRTFSGHDMVVTVQVPITRASSIVKVIGAFQTITYSIHNDKSPVRVLGDMNVRRYVFGPRTVAGTLILTVFDRHWMKELMGTYKKIKGETERYYLMDELPAFNITISCANEYGHNAKLALYGVTIVNEGQVMSINDVYTENTYQFFATNIEYLDRVEHTSNSNLKTPLSNLPIKSQTQKVDSSTTQSNPGNASETSGSTNNDDPTYGGILESAEGLDKYDDNDKRKEYLDELDMLVQTADTDEDGMLDDAERAATVRVMNEKARKEANRRVELWKENILYPKLDVLKRNHDNGTLTDEQYSQMKRTLMGESMLLNTQVIVKGEYSAVNLALNSPGNYETVMKNAKKKTGEEQDVKKFMIDYKKYESVGIPSAAESVNSTHKNFGIAKKVEEGFLETNTIREEAYK